MGHSLQGQTLPQVERRMSSSTPLESCGRRLSRCACYCNFLLLATLFSFCTYIGASVYDSGRVMHPGQDRRRPPDLSLDEDDEAGTDCPHQTGGNCYFFGCSDWRNAQCVEGKCVCPSNMCSVDGACLPQSNWSKPDHARRSRPRRVRGKGNFTALVLSGGGAKGAYELGVLEGICGNSSLHKYRNWSMIVGTSIGALNAGALAQYPQEQQCTEALRAAQGFWDSIKAPEDVWVSSESGSADTSREPCLTAVRAMSMAMGFWRRGGVCDPAPGRRAFEFAVQRERIRDSGMMLRVVATSLQTGQPKWWKETDDSIIEGCEASGAIAPLVYPKEVDGVGYVDGGFVANTPIMKALEEGAQTVLVVELEPLSSHSFIPSLQKLYKDDVNVGLRILEFEVNVMQQRYFLEHELQLACERFPDRKIVGFLPRSNVGDFMQFTADALQRMREEGRRTVANESLVDLCHVFYENSLVVEDFSDSDPDQESHHADTQPDGKSSWPLACSVGLVACFLALFRSACMCCRSRESAAEAQFAYAALDV